MVKSVGIYIDLFVGCGGFILRLVKVGWEGVFVIEKGKDVFVMLKYNLVDRGYYVWLFRLF